MFSHAQVIKVAESKSAGTHFKQVMTPQGSSFLLLLKKNSFNDFFWNPVHPSAHVSSGLDRNRVKNFLLPPNHLYMLLQGALPLQLKDELQCLGKTLHAFCRLMPAGKAAWMTMQAPSWGDHSSTFPFCFIDSFRCLHRLQSSYWVCWPQTSFFCVSFYPKPFHSFSRHANSSVPPFIPFFSCNWSS